MPLKTLGLFETHLTVRDLDRSLRFYGDTLGFELAADFSDRHCAFFWIGPQRDAMLGLWEIGTGPQQMQLHTAFRVSLDELLRSCDALRSAGIEPLDFAGAPTDTPVVIAWMPAAVVYFRDPDGHLLEYLTMLPDSPRPELGIVPWRDWEDATR
jgi:lactoylglutathione lyase